MGRKITTKELGLYKTKISNALLQSENIRDVVLGDTDGLRPNELMAKFKDHVKSHLFIDEVIKDTASFIYYDVHMPFMAPQIKTAQIIIYAICHRDILENYAKDNYYGNRTDIMAQMIEETLLDESIVKDFGIGNLDLDNVDIYNSVTFYGRILTFSVRNFR